MKRISAWVIMEMNRFKYYSVSIALSIMITFLISSTPAYCQMYFSRPGTDTLYITTYKTTWTNAESAAQSLGGHLVTINDAAEQAYLEDNVLPDIINTLSENEFWIGFNDTAVEGTWEWISGEPVTYTNWRSGEPNNSHGNEDYGVLVGWSDSEWNDTTNSTWLFVGLVECIDANSDNTCDAPTPTPTPTATSTATATPTSTPTPTPTATATPEPFCQIGNEYIQNENITGSQVFPFEGYIAAGENVDPGVPSGPVVIQNGGDVEMYSTDYVRLEQGFSVVGGGLLKVEVNSGACDE